MISPLEFIPTAEESGLIIPIGTWVIDEICRQNSIWKKEGLQIVPIAANLSASQLKTKEIVDVVKKSLSKNELSPKSISLELTESMIMDDVESVNEILSQFRALGVSIAIDDFGTGYSSLSYLQELPVDIIKIDRSFIKDINSKNSQAFIANTIVTLAHNLGCKVLAEGIETSTQDNYMKNKGCDLAQGFLYSKPISSEKFKLFLKQKS